MTNSLNPEIFGEEIRQIQEKWDAHGLGLSADSDFDRSTWPTIIILK